MKLRSKHSPLLLLLLPTIVSALAPHTIAEDTPVPAAAVAAPDSADSPPAPGLKRHGVPTKDAPVDGKDGKPHLGPFVETDGVVSTGTEEKEVKELPILKGRPDDPTVVDGKKIPKTNDGVMFDKNREHAVEGNTGLEGGVSEKDKARKAQEGRTGEKATKEPTAPKEQPPLPHSEEQKIKGKPKTDEKETVKTSKGDKDEDTSFTGLDVGVSLESGL
jgi:Ca2+/H+ antiporter, TMEM165/GDT1 family